jgi:uncharacterized SAM-binding protein YcdF (DUF218 family)
MWVWLRMVLALGVVLLPGGFPLVLVYVALRTLRAKWRQAQEQAQANPAQAAPHKSNSERWLLASNVLGIAVAAVLVLYFGLRMFSDVDLTSSLPDFSAAQNQQAAGIISWVVAATSVCVAAMFTPLGRWLRSEFT